MKYIPLALLSLAAVSFAGCTTYDKPDGDVTDSTQPQTPVVTNTPSTVQPIPGGTGESIGERGAPVAFNLFNDQTGDYDPRAVLATVNFGYDKYSVDATARSLLNTLPRGKRLIAAGYTDYYGTEQYNTGLSDRRAQSVIAYLNSAQISNNVEKQAFGKKYARATGTRDDVAPDRKVVVVDADYNPNAAAGTR
jgi:outer membrane protein OmpA-like peptidoglycan-associated protein